MEATTVLPPHWPRELVTKDGEKRNQIASHRFSCMSGFFEHTDIHVASSQITAYGRNGNPSQARQLFDHCYARDVVLWNSLISAFSRLSLVEEALQSFAKMQDEGIFPNVVTFSCILKALANGSNIRPALQKGEKIHRTLTTLILQKGKQIHTMLINNENLHLRRRNVVLNTALVDMYLKSGDLVKAQEVFDEIVIRDVVSWNVLISGYVQHGCGVEALSCFSHMLDEGLCPDSITFACVLKACGIIASAEKGEKIHAQVLPENHNVQLGNALVDMYVKCGEVWKAREVFNELDVRDIVTWNALIGGYVHCGYSDEALECLGQMRDEGISPDSITFTSILKACGSIGLIQKGEEIHAMVKKLGLLEDDVVLNTALIDMYAKCGVLRKAQTVFDNLQVRNVISWNALIVGYAQHGHDVAAMECFARMQYEGFSPNAITFSCVLKVCGRRGLIERGEQIHAEVAKRGFLLGGNAELLGTALVDMYAKCGALKKAQVVFDSLPMRSASTWTALLAGYAYHGFSIEAFNVSLRMQDEGRGLSPDIVTLACILKACGGLGVIKKGEEIHKQVIERGLLREDIILGTALVDMYAKCGCLSKAQGVFNELSLRDAALWNALIGGYAQLGQAREVLILLSEMMKESVSPDLITFLVLLNACSHAGLVQEGEMYYNVMTITHSLSPSFEHYACMVDLWGSAGQLDKAIVLIEDLTAPDRLRPLSILMACCQKWVNVELGRWAFEHLLELSGKNAALYVSMSNIYMQASDMPSST